MSPRGHRRGMENPKPPPRPSGGFEQRRETPVPRQSAILRQIVRSGEDCLVGADGKPTVLLDHVHDRERARAIHDPTRPARSLDHPGEHTVVTTHPHAAIPGQVGLVQFRRPPRRPGDLTRGQGFGFGLPTRRLDEAELAPRRQGAFDAGTRDLFADSPMLDTGIDQILDGAAGPERFPKQPPAGVERHDHSIRRDHHQLIRERQRDAVQVDRAR